jgi:hypothetical protein
VCCNTACACSFVLAAEAETPAPTPAPALDTSLPAPKTEQPTALLEPVAETPVPATEVPATVAPTATSPPTDTPTASPAPVAADALTEAPVLTKPPAPANFAPPSLTVRPTAAALPAGKLETLPQAGMHTKVVCSTTVLTTITVLSAGHAVLPLLCDAQISTQRSLQRLLLPTPGWTPCSATNGATYKSLLAAGERVASELPKQAGVCKQTVGYAVGGCKKAVRSQVSAVPTRMCISAAQCCACACCDALALALCDVIHIVHTVGTAALVTGRILQDFSKAGH